MHRRFLSAHIPDDFELAHLPPHATIPMTSSRRVKWALGVGDTNPNTERFAHHERTAAELFGSDAVVDGSDYDQSEYVQPVGAGLRDFFSDGSGPGTQE